MLKAKIPHCIGLSLHISLGGVCVVVVVVTAGVGAGLLGEGSGAAPVF